MGSKKLTIPGSSKNKSKAITVAKNSNPEPPKPDLHSTKQKALLLMSKKVNNKKDGEKSTN